MLFVVLLLFLFLFVSTSVLAQDTSLREITKAFDAAEIPHDATIKFNPTILLEVNFPRIFGPPIHVKAGEQIPQNDTAVPPFFGIQIKGSPGLIGMSEDTFVIAMVDLDAPSPSDPLDAQVRHFLGGNFRLERPGAVGFALLKNSTPAISDFLQPTPSAGLHRYVFLLFKQSRAFNTQMEVNASTSILNFNISNFAEEIDLGSPLGGSFILVRPPS